MTPSSRSWKRSTISETGASTTPSSSLPSSPSSRPSQMNSFGACSRSLTWTTRTSSRSRTCVRRSTGKARCRYRRSRSTRWSACTTSTAAARSTSKSSKRSSSAPILATRKESKSLTRFKQMLKSLLLMMSQATTQFQPDASIYHFNFTLLFFFIPSKILEKRKCSSAYSMSTQCLTSSLPLQQLATWGHTEVLFRSSDNTLLFKSHYRHIHFLFFSITLLRKARWGFGTFG